MNVRPALLLIILLTMQGCSDRERPSTTQDNTASPQRVICGSPAVTEIVFELGAGDRVVGVSQYANYPPDATTKARIGGWINPNRERLLVLRPDLIITQGKHEAISSFANEYNIQLLALKLDTLDDMMRAVGRIAEKLGDEKAGRTFIAELAAAFRETEKRVSGTERHSVLVLVGRTPGDLTGLTTVGPGTFLHEMVGIAGGTNIFSDAVGMYPQISKEALLVRKPQVILEIQPDGLSGKAVDSLRKDWNRFSSIPAVAEGRIYCLTNDYLLILGSRAAQTALRIAEALHPEAFRE